MALQRYLTAALGAAFLCSVGTASALTPATRVVFVETIANPRTQVADLKRIGELCRSRGIVYVVDNTMTSPYLFQPRQVGASLVVNALTKSIGGHGNALGGALTDAAKEQLAGDPATALERLDRLRERAAAIDGASSVEYALVSWQRMLVERQLHHTEQGLARLDEVERLWQALVPPEHPIFAHVHRYRAAFAAMRGDQALARRELDAALSAFDANGALPVDVAVTRGELAAVALAQGQRDEARQLLGKALPVLRDALLPTEVNRAAAERSAISGERARRAAVEPATPADPGASVGDGEVTYADFLGDEVED